MYAFIFDVYVRCCLKLSKNSTAATAVTAKKIRRIWFPYSNIWFGAGNEHHRHPKYHTHTQIPIQRVTHSLSYTRIHIQTCICLTCIHMIKRVQTHSCSLVSGLVVLFSFFFFVVSFVHSIHTRSENKSRITYDAVFLHGSDSDRSLSLFLSHSLLYSNS